MNTTNLIVDEGAIQRIMAILTQFGFHVSAECDLDAAILDCSLLHQFDAGALCEIPQEVVTIQNADHEGITIDVSSDLANAIRDRGSKPNTRFDVSLSGIDTLLVMNVDLRTRWFDVDCVFGGELARPPKSPEESSRVVRSWCEAVARLGVIMGASRVECNVIDALNPVILWRRTDTPVGQGN